MAVDKKGEKNFKRGMQHEAAQQWEDAVTEFALAVAARPANIEYQLHYRRAIFNASQSFMMRGRALAEREDYVGAYNAFRQSYGYDPTNQLALSEMERVMRLQREKDERDNPNAKTPATNNPNTVARMPTTPAFYEQNPVRASSTARGQEPALPALTPEKLRIINYNGDLEGLIKKLAEELNLNVIFDEQLNRSPRQISLNLRDVTTAQALDYIFLTRNLFFQKLGRRTILVADAQKRQQYQQLALRTFFLKNILPEDAQRILQSAFPPQPGRGAIQAAQNKATNSITVRDTPENLRVVEELIRSLDKERAAMVFDVQIYEVSRTDLLQLGGQLGDTGNFGGTSGLLVPFGGNPRTISPRDTAGNVLSLPTALGTGLIIPSLQLSALQRKNNTRLLESTQLHAFDNEDVEQRIGQRVPVQTASAFPFTGGTSTPGQNNNNSFGGGFPVINYEPTGLTIKFTKPQVFPSVEGDYDVQVQMKLESKDVIGGSTAQPVFSERSLTGTARIKNNRTLMLASVARNQEARGRSGLPLLGLIPILGRFISTPTRNDEKRDIVIAITPRVLRAPSITPDDQLTRAVGSQATPLSDSLQAFVQEAEREEQLARASGIPLPPPTAVPTPVLAQATTQTASGNSAQNNPAPPAPVTISANMETNPLPASTGIVPEDYLRYIPAPRVLLPAARLFVSESGAAAVGAPLAASAVLSNAAVKPAMLDNASAAVAATVSAPTMTTTSAPATSPVAHVPVSDAPVAAMSFVPEDQRMRAGERRQVMLMLSTDAPVNLAIATLRFDPKIVAVRDVKLGNFSTAKDLQPLLSHSTNPLGMLLVSLATPQYTPLMQGTGVLLVLEIEALAVGESNLEVAADSVHLVTTDKSTLAKRTTGGRIIVTK
jgi:general secretion pathway protein D